jgi:uncharacterized Zn finger protein
MYERTERALEIARWGTVERIDVPEIEKWRVSGDSGMSYTVSYDTKTGKFHCTCPDYKNKELYCKHIQAVFIIRSSVSDGN